MINTLIIDDQEINCILLKGLLERFFPDLIRPHILSNPAEALETIAELQPELLFLDITMPEMNGFELLQNIRKSYQTEVIFVTAYSEFALHAYDYHPAGYITKPVATEKFVKTVNHAIRLIDRKKDTGLVETLKKAITSGINEKKITLSSQKGLVFVDPSKMLYGESSGNYTTFFLLEGEQIVVSKQIGSFEKKLDEYSFLRVHDRFLVNLQHITHYLRGNGGTLILSNGKEIPVSVRRKHQLLESFGE